MLQRGRFGEAQQAGGFGFGNLLFVWDMLLGTAKITRRYPPRVGLKDDTDHGAERWRVQLLYPLLKSRRAASTLAPAAPAGDPPVPHTVR